MNSPNNAKVVPSGSAMLGERIHIHTIARSAREPPEKPQFPRLLLTEKKRFGSGQGDDVIDDCCVISPAAQHRNATVNLLNGRVHFLSYRGFYLTDFDAGWLVLTGR